MSVTIQPEARVLWRSFFFNSFPEAMDIPKHILVIQHPVIKRGCKLEAPISVKKISQK